MVGWVQTINYSSPAYLCAQYEVFLSSLFTSLRFNMANPPILHRQ